MALSVDALFASELLSAGLALFIVYAMLRSFRVMRREYILGFPIGFSFLAVSFVTLGLSYEFSSLAEPATWVHLFIQSYGYAFLAGSYMLRKREAGRLSQWLFSLAVILAVFVVLVVVVPPPLSLPSYQVADEAFRTLNIILLAYILFSLNQALKFEPLAISSPVLTGFLFLGFSQYSLLLWALDGGFWSFALAHLLRLFGLVALVFVSLRVFRVK
jgi:hypothetical protein